MLRAGIFFFVGTGARLAVECDIPMIHPDTELRFVNEEIGYGVFATRPIPTGTIVCAKDGLEIEFTLRQFERLDAAHRAVVNKYSYIDQRGVRIVSWDHAKYVNHC